MRIYSFVVSSMGFMIIFGGSFVLGCCSFLGSSFLACSSFLASSVFFWLEMVSRDWSICVLVLSLENMESSTFLFSVS